MDRSNYPTQVEVRRGDLTYTESSKIEQVLRRTVDLSQPGIISGLTVQASAGSNTRVDLLAGYGYVPKGELIELRTTLSSQPVGTLIVGVPVLVGLMYREVEGKAGASETDGVARPRRISRSSEFKVFTAAQWDALPESFDTDLSVDARDRFLICGIVELPVVSTDPLIITLPPTFNIIKTIPQPSNITGAVITSLSQDTKNSNPFPFSGVPDPAQIIFEPSTQRIAYAAPFDAVNLAQAAPFSGAGVGVPVTLTTSGSVTLTSANGLDTLTLTVDLQLLPSTTVGASISDNLEVTALYAKVADRGSSKDELHRHMLGGQIPNEENPHGVRFSDIATLVEEIIGTLKLGTRYVSTLAQAEVPKLVFPANPLVNNALGSARYQSVGELDGATTSFTGATPMKIRFYRSGTDSFIILLNAKVLNQGASATFVRATANGDNPQAQAAMIELSPFAVVLYAHDSTAAHTWDFSQWSRVQFFHSFSSDSTTLTGRLTLGTGLHSSSTGRLTSRMRADYSEASVADGRTLIWSSQKTPTPSAGITARLYRVRQSMPLFSAQTDTIELILGAEWNAAGHWVKDIAGRVVKIEAGQTRVIFTSRTAGLAASTFTDDFDGSNGWDAQPIVFDLSTGAVTATGYNFTPVRTFTKAINALQGIGTAAVFDGSVTVDGSGNLALVGGTGGFACYWDFELPNGATIISADAWLRCDHNAGTVVGEISRLSRASPPVVTQLNSAFPSTIAATASGGSDWESRSLTVNQNAVVDNGTHVYRIVVSATSDALISIQGWIVTYTVPGVLLP